MFKVRADERLMLVGTTGSGKSELAKFLLPMAGERVLVIDPKGEFALNGFKRGDRLPLFGSKWQMIYTPKHEDDDTLTALLWECYERGQCRIYCDEYATVHDLFPKASVVLEDIARRGRSRQVSLWGATQRPRNIPKLLFTESEVWCVFLLRDPADRRHVAGYVGPEALVPMQMHHFLYLRPGMEVPIELTLDLSEHRLKKVDREVVEVKDEREATG